MYHWTDEQTQFLKENVEGRLSSELAEMINKKFGTNVSVTQVQSKKSNMGFRSGINAQFKKGHLAHNLGKRMSPEQYEIAKRTMFKKGNRPKNVRPVGSERINVYGYVEIKVAEPNVWKLKHKVLYEEHYGVLPRGWKVVFLDGDKTNITIENLEAVTEAEMLILNRYKMLYPNQELTKSSIANARLLNQINKVKKRYEEKENVKK